MEKKNELLKRIHALGRFYILLGVLDIIILLGNLLAESDGIRAAMAGNGLSKEVNIAFLIIMAGTSVIFALMKFFIGFQGLRYSFLKPIHQACEPIAKVLFLLSIFVLLAQIPEALKGNVNFVSICNCVASMIMIYYFLECVKQLKE